MGKKMPDHLRKPLRVAECSAITADSPLVPLFDEPTDFDYQPEQIPAVGGNEAGALLDDGSGSESVLFGG